MLRFFFLGARHGLSSSNSIIRSLSVFGITFLVDIFAKRLLISSRNEYSLEVVVAVVDDAIVLLL
jgi:hypothetical protein